MRTRALAWACATGAAVVALWPPPAGDPRAWRGAPVSPAVAKRAAELLETLTLGDVRIEWIGLEGWRKFVCEIHGPDAGHPYDHKGVTAYAPAA